MRCADIGVLGICTCDGVMPIATEHYLQSHSCDWTGCVQLLSRELSMSE